MDPRMLANRCMAQLNRTPITQTLARVVHAHILTSGFTPSPHVVNRLIDIYCKSSNICYARQLFDKVPKPDIVARTTLVAAYSSMGNIRLAKEVFYATPLSMRDTVSYNSMITAYSRDHDGHAAVRLFKEMRMDRFVPDPFSFASVLGALSLIADEEMHCQQLHCEVIKWGVGCMTSVLNALISAYVNCASSPLVSSSVVMVSARKLFDEMLERDELSWTTIIAGYVRNDDLGTARELLDGMTEKIAVAWNAMISGYVRHGINDEAFALFRKMQVLGIKLDEYAYTSIISASSNVGLFKYGRQGDAREEPLDMDRDDIGLSAKWLWRRRFEAFQRDEVRGTTTM